MAKTIAETTAVSDSKKELAEQTSSRLAKLAEEEKKTVKGRFRNFENPGCSATVTVLKYPEKYCPKFVKTMMDNEAYEIPLYVARFLNGTDITAKEAGYKINTCSSLIHGFHSNPDGSVKVSDGTDPGGIPVPVFTNKYRRRYGFESLEFDL
jgi:hypothetical protein